MTVPPAPHPPHSAGLPGAALPGRVRVGYALGALVTGAFGTVPGLLLLPYLTDSIGVAAGVAGLLVLVPKAWDVLVNPVAGRISDRTRSRWGARRPYVLGGGLTLAVLFVMMFAAPFGTGAAAGGYVAVVFLLAASAFAVFQVPYVAMLLGLFVAGLIVIGTVGAFYGTRSAPGARRGPAGRCQADGAGQRAARRCSGPAARGAADRVPRPPPAPRLAVALDRSSGAGRR